MFGKSTSNTLMWTLKSIPGWTNKDHPFSMNCQWISMNWRTNLSCNKNVHNCNLIWLIGEFDIVGLRGDDDDGVYSFLISKVTLRNLARPGAPTMKNLHFGWRKIFDGQCHDDHQIGVVCRCERSNWNHTDIATRSKFKDGDLVCTWIGTSDSHLKMKWRVLKHAIIS